MDGKPSYEIQSLEHETQHDYREFDELIRESMTTYLSSRARKLVLPLPSEDDAWSEGYLFRNRILTEKGIAQLRSAIRQEESEKSHLWVTPIASPNLLVTELALGLFLPEEAVREAIESLRADERITANRFKRW